MDEEKEEDFFAGGQKTMRNSFDVRILRPDKCDFLTIWAS
jgi:hypothetical protein